jgi:hypothetical protein
MTPDAGTEDVAATGCVGTVSNIGPGAPVEAACAAGFAALSGLCAAFSDFSDGAEDFAALSVLCVGFADLSGLRADCACGAEFASAADAANASAVKRPTAANAIISRMAVTGTDLSVRSAPAGVSGIPSSACEIDELLMRARRHGNRRIVGRKQGTASARVPIRVCLVYAMNVQSLRPESR